MSKWPLNSGPEAPSRTARGTCPNNSSIRLLRGEVVGLSGVMARSKNRRRGYPHPGTHVADHNPSELRSSHSMRIPDRQELVVRMSCCATSDWFAEEEKGRVEMRSLSLRGVVTYSRFPEMSLPRSPQRQPLSRRIERGQNLMTQALRGHRQLPGGREARPKMLPPPEKGPRASCRLRQ